MKPRDIVLEQTRHHETDRIPYTLPIGAEVNERLDEHYGGEDWREELVKYVAQCGGITKPQNEKLDDNRHRDVFGSVWRTDREPPSVVEPGLKAPTFEGYDFPSPDVFLDAETKEATKKRVVESTESFTIVSVGPCLWEGWYLRGFEQTLMDCVAEDDFFAELLERLTELCLAIIEACADIPADAIMMGDDWGNQQGVMVGPDRWRKFYKPRYARIFQAIHDQGKQAIMHCCGSAADIMADIVEIGLDIFESVQPEAAGMNPYELKKAWGDQITFWGCLGSQSTIPFGTPEEIREEIGRLRREMGKGGGYILAPAKPLRPETPTENAVAILEELLAG